MADTTLEDEDVAMECAAGARQDESGEACEGEQASAPCSPQQREQPAPDLEDDTDIDPNGCASSLRWCGTQWQRGGTLETARPLRDRLATAYERLLCACDNYGAVQFVRTRLCCTPASG